MDNEQLWQAVLGEIELAVSKANFTTWFKKTFISSCAEQEVVISVPNVFTKAWLEKKYRKELVTALENVTKRPNLKIVYKIENKKPNISLEKPSDASLEVGGSIGTVNLKISSLNKFGLNSRYTFQNFIIGKNNELAHAAALAVAANPGVAYNPLVIYGGVGLGKTHLLQAIGHELVKTTDKVIYATSEKFTNDYINEVQSGRAKFLKEKYRNVDLLLIDDIQFLGGKDGTQEEFFHTFNELHQANKQIVVTCDRPLKTIPALEKRLLSRLEWGMVADITLPDYETRIAILQRKCQEKNYLLPEKIVFFLAENIAANVRELEGALTKLITYFQFNNLAPDLEVAKKVLAENIINARGPKLKSDYIMDATSKYYNIAIRDLISKSRKKELVRPRQIVMYLLRKEIEMSFPNIGKELGGRDHTTAIHACHKIEREMALNERISQEIKAIRQLLKSFD